VIELEWFTVRGLKSLAEIKEIPVRRPTIITGANDGGKSTTLRAVSFLLGGWMPSEDDYTKLGPPSDGTKSLLADEIVVEGRFFLSATDAERFGLADQISLRRVLTRQGAARYEILAKQPVDHRLRQLDDRKIADLQQLAGELGLEPSGKRSARDSWLDPLNAYAGTQAWEEAWTPVSRDLLDRLPTIMMFSSTEEPDPESQIRNALHTAYRELLNDSELIGPVRQVESKVQKQLEARADELCKHVRERCPELSEIRVKPEVTFSEGFRHVGVFASRPGGAGISLSQSGAGRRRRINLAIWEWTGDLLNARSADDRAVVLAYDEPDTHLDYGHQRELVGLIRDQCQKPGVRMLVATHSLNLIDRVAIEDVVHLRLDDQHTTAEQLMDSRHDEIQRYLASVSEAMGLRNSVLLHERCFVGVEGPTEVQALPILFRLATGMSMQSAGIALISGNGNDGALKVVRFLKDNGRRLAFVVVDGDSTDSKLFKPERLKAAGIDTDHIYFVGDRELEDLFSNEQWAAVANREWPRTNKAEWMPTEFGAMRHESKFSNAIEEAVRTASIAAPQSKPGYLLALVQGLQSGIEVPASLTTVLKKLAAFADGDD
jgi:putative ATP-dependent endonuclease of the OLD family